MGLSDDSQVSPWAGGDTVQSCPYLGRTSLYNIFEMYSLPLLRQDPLEEHIPPGQVNI